MSPFVVVTPKNHSPLTLVRSAHQTGRSYLKTTACTHIPKKSLGNIPLREELPVSASIPVFDGGSTLEDVVGCTVRRLAADAPFTADDWERPESEGEGPVVTEGRILVLGEGNGLLVGDGRGVWASPG